MENLSQNYIGEGIYKENILDHFKNPRNYGNLDNATIKFKDSNPLCGDVIEMQLKINNGMIEDVRFLGRGCAISQAAASMLTEEIKGKNIEEVKSIDRNNIIEMLNIPIGPVRVKCAVLSLIALRNCIRNIKNG